MDSTNINSLVTQLSSPDKESRVAARESLVEIGGQVVTRALVVELLDPRQEVRWEAAKALASIGDPIAALPLLHAMDDEDHDVRWLATEGLIALGKTGLLSVLSGLTRQSRSQQFCAAAHHVLRELKKKFDSKLIASVLAALDGPEPAVSAPVSAFKALQQLMLEGRR